MPSHATDPYGHRPSRTTTTFALWLALACGAEALRSQTIAHGLTRASFALPAPAKGWADIAVFGDRILAYDGAKIRSFEATGGREGPVVADTGVTVFGSFLSVGPTGGALFVGESSGGTLRAYELASKSWRLVATLGGIYRLAWRPLEGERFAYVSARPSAKAEVVRVDTLSGATQTLVSVAGYSGPLAFDRARNLYFAPAPLRFGVPGLGVILRWTAAQVDDAIANKLVLDESSASRFAEGFDNAGDMAFDPEGTLYASDQFSLATSSILELGGGTSYARDFYRVLGESKTAIDFEHGAKPFERHGRGGSAMWVLSTDFANKHNVHKVVPVRPLLYANTTNPAPGGALRLDSVGLPRSQLAIFLFGAGLRPEAPIAPLGHGGLMFPDFAVIPFGGLVTVITQADATGRASLSGFAPLVSKAQWTTQILAGPVPALPGGGPSSPWVTSNPVTVRVR